MKATFFKAIVFCFFVCSNVLGQTKTRFNIKEDFLLVNFDCKTDVDDLHSVAALFTLLAHQSYKKINMHAIAGTYGIQEGLYVPPNDLMKLAFGKNWSDAHENRDFAVRNTLIKIKKTLTKNGQVWIAEAGQSDFTSDLVKAIQKAYPSINTKERVHVVQHSNWNEEVTTPALLKWVKANTDYHKIPDGNVVGNGTPGFRTPGYTAWKTQIKKSKLLAIWVLAYNLGQEFNGKDGRYNNQAVAANGLDFSDLSEVCWILNRENIKDTEEFFERFGK